MHQKLFAEMQDVARRLESDPDCPYHLIRMGELIQLQDADVAPPLAEAERALLTAHKLDPDYIEAMQALAHYYDAVADNPDFARQYADLCLQAIAKVHEEMIAIVNQ